MNETNEPEINCPADCPNRRSADEFRQRGRRSGFLLGSLLLVLVVAFSVENIDGQWRPKKDPPLVVLLILLPMTGACWGVPIDAEPVGRILSTKVDLLGK
ncbi:hypothetical protein [Pantanalinema sp. GBBB05]|uniref:hypothetical protein n=1 Tax=Pantanalinema sp. GBBB05 TaxID=2604139 RepID=UPI001DA05298|nr:hypothetical protein [Pantanalinema sp. GBBB05]